MTLADAFAGPPARARVPRHPSSHGDDIMHVVLVIYSKL